MNRGILFLVAYGKQLTLAPHIIHVYEFGERVVHMVEI